jgi:hypothetical protein
LASGEPSVRCMVAAKPGARQQEDDHRTGQRSDRHPSTRGLASPAGCGMPSSHGS